MGIFFASAPAYSLGRLRFGCDGFSATHKYLRLSVTFVAKTPADESRVIGEVAERLGDVRFEF